ncbi:hypothetical protein [Paenibacillus chibensis]|uniref:hypothetical protein n=1 Tax=Paenibacillus chibensis TaxID=59846 RepID=UPI003D2C88CA
MIPLVFLAAILAIILMGGFYFAVAYFGLKFLYKKLFRRPVDPMILMAAMTMGVFLILIGQRLWYHQQVEMTLLLPPIAVLGIMVRHIRMRSRRKS